MTAPTEADGYLPEDRPATDVAEFEQEFAGTPGRTPLVIKLLVAATFVVILNETIMINAIPTLMGDFGIDERAAQWLSTIFMLTMAAVIPITGWFLQRVSTRTAYAVAMATFSTGTLLAAVSPAFPVLLVARVVQASGTAVMMPLLMTTLMTVVAQSDRGRVMGQVTLAMSCAPALGPAVSGVLLQLGSWRLIFAVVLPIAAAVGYFGLRQLENVGEPQVSSVSWTSVVLAATGFATLVYGLSQIGHAGAGSTTAFIAAGAVLVAVFAAYQLRLQRSDAPLLDLRTLRHRNFTVSLLLMAAGFMAFLGSMILLPLYLQNPLIRDLSPLQTGLMVMPGGLTMGLLGPQVGKLYDRFGSRPLVIPGSIGMVACLLFLAQISLTTPFALIIGVHVLLMASLAAIFTPVFTIGLGDLPPHLYSHGSSLLGTLQQVAGAIGTALLVVVMTNRADDLGGITDPEAFVGGLQWAFYVGAGMGVVVVLLALLLPSRVEAPEGAPAAH
ncbi:MDR family MFS transporter [Nocardioides sp. MH1]|uniref:MDR family MFS transporter n=1 Tax=Nocardioides sp. MH1 TaxID=3242490 RepID=UPI00351FD7FE